MFLAGGLQPAEGRRGLKRAPPIFGLKVANPGLTLTKLGPVALKEMLECRAQRSGRKRGKPVQVTGLQGDKIVQKLDFCELQ